MPSQWTITLEGPASPDIPATAPHAVVSRWLDIDHQAPVKPYAISPPTTRGKHTTLRIRLLDDALAGPLAHHTTTGSTVRLGHHHFTVHTPPVLEHGTSWQALTSTPPHRAWDVTYLSPVTFRRRNRTSPWPAPDSVLTSLSARWQALDPGTAPTLRVDGLRSVWVSDIDGSSQAFALKDTVISGFVGRLRYMCDDGPALSDIAALFAFARYAGIGSHTAYGLGTITVAPSHPETTRRPAADTALASQRPPTAPVLSR